MEMDCCCGVEGGGIEGGGSGGAVLVIVGGGMLSISSMSKSGRSLGAINVWRVRGIGGACVVGASECGGGCGLGVHAVGCGGGGGLGVHAKGCGDCFGVEDGCFGVECEAEPMGLRLRLWL